MLKLDATLKIIYKRMKTIQNKKEKKKKNQYL
jgi:hypothetical protein